MKVSVYCTVFNHEKYLRGTLEGFVSQQTNFPFEVFVHDDASTDGSADIIREFAEKYPDIIKPIIQTENQYSKGLKIFSTFIRPHVSGQYIAVCEGDDRWTDPQKLQLQADFLDSHPEYSACAHNTTKEDLQTGIVSTMYPQDGDRDITLEQALHGPVRCFHTSSIMYRIQYVDNRPEFFKKAKSFGDYPLMIYLTLSGKVRFLARTMSYYRFGSAGSWTSRSRANVNSLIRNHQYAIDMLEEVNRYTENKYQELIQPIILENEYKKLYYSGDYRRLRRAPYRNLYKKESFSFRIKTHIKQWFKGPYKLYRKLTYK